MFTPVRKFVVYCWNFVFNHEVSPLRNIPDVAIRHYVLQALGLMWAVAFAVAAGSYTFLAVSRGRGLGDDTVRQQKPRRQFRLDGEIDVLRDVAGDAGNL